MVKNITLSADETAIQKARARAARDHTSLNKAFRQWLQRYGGEPASEAEYRALMRRLSYARPGRAFGRDELNAR